MSKINHTTKTKYNHLTIIGRAKIETLLNEKKSIKYIAKQLGRNQSTIYREIKRGSVKQIVNHNGFQQDELKYYAETSGIIYKKKQQNKYNDTLTEKFSQIFFIELTAAITEKFRIYSIDTFVHWYKQNNPNEKYPVPKQFIILFIKVLLPSNQLIHLK